MATVNTTTTLASRLKTVYPNGITQLVPSSTELMKRLKFKKELSPGEQAQFDVQLTHELGFSVGTGNVALNAAIAQETAKAQVDGYGVYLRSQVAYDLIAKAKDSKQAFAKFNDSKFIPMVESFKKREEILACHGRVGLGIVKTNGGSGVLTIREDQWCPALWVGSKGAVLEAFTATTGGSQHNTDLTITAVDIANRTVTVSGTSAAVDVGDYLFFKGHRGAEPYGLWSIARNTGTLYNISASTYELWAANSYDCGTSAITFAKILEASAMSANKGCDEPLLCLVPPKAFQKLAADQGSMREYGVNYNKAKAENGFESLVFHGATGPIEVMPHLYSKEGESIMFPERYTSLIGAQEATNVVGPGGDIVFDLEGYTSKEMRMMAHWTVFCEKPGYITYITRSDNLALHT
jgi:hypothetical protein